MQRYDKGVVCAISGLFGILSAALLEDNRWYIFAIIGILAYLYKPSESKTALSVLRDCGISKKKGESELIPHMVYQKETDAGYETGLILPVGLSSRDCARKQQAISEALNADVSFSYRDGKTVMKVNQMKFKKQYPFAPIDVSHPVEIPIGYGRDGFKTLVFNDSYSNLLVGGTPGSGKSVFLRQAIVNLIIKSKVKINLIDLKAGVEFAMFRKCVCDLATNEEEAMILLSRLEKMTLDRYRQFRALDVVNITDHNRKYPPMDFHIVICDEYANLRQFQTIQATFDKLLRLCRAVGIYFIICTQRPSAETLPGIIKANIQATLAFKTRNELNSRILIDDGDAAYLECAGRGIFQTDQNREVQVMYLGDDEAREMVRGYEKKAKEQNHIVGATKMVEPEGVISIEDYRKRSPHN